MTFEQIKNLLNMTDDAATRLEILMDIGRELPPAPAGADCTEITGCASFVQICRVGNNFYGVADSAIVRGIVAVFISIVDGKSPAQIKKLDLEKIFADLKINVGAARLNGVNSMIRFFKNL
ncbi:MAG: SufE family protein [Alphaproteobacteria bacterium]|nr:SufE family protein [Alphaproteobacteria bacterium]